MREKSMWGMGHHGTMAVLIGVVLVGLAGCAGDPPKPAPTMTPEQVRSNTDKAFERLKQEEKNRAVGSEPAPY